VANLPPKRDELLDLYKIHTEEVRFQTKFNWDRTQYLLVLKVGVIGVAAGVWKGDAPLPTLFLIAALFLAGIFMSLMSVAAIRQGHKYYRQTVLQKTRVEFLLGLFDIDSGTPFIPAFDLTNTSTAGKKDAADLLGHPEKYLEGPAVKRGQINWYIRSFLYFLAVINLAGLIMVVFQLVPQLIWQ
jgi:hypothetical protein